MKQRNKKNDYQERNNKNANNISLVSFKYSNLLNYIVRNYQIVVCQIFVPIIPNLNKRNQAVHEIIIIKAKNS